MRFLLKELLNIDNIICKMERKSPYVHDTRYDQAEKALRLSSCSGRRRSQKMRGQKPRYKCAHF
jgi:hypothetical protein